MDVRVLAPCMQTEWKITVSEFLVILLSMAAFSGACRVALYTCMPFM